MKTLQMLLSAASLVIAMVASDVNDLSERELKAWKKIQPSVVSLMDGSHVRGSAALISRDGFFIAHATAISGKSIDARKEDGTTIKLLWVTTDVPTQFVLLKSEGWSDSSAPFTIADSDAGSKSLLAITPTGPVRAERGSKDTFGIVNPSRRFMPMSEIMLENNLPTLSGSLLFNLNGELAGALNATLGMTDSQNQQKSRADTTNQKVSSDSGSRGAQGPGVAPRLNNNMQYGPGILTAAYSIGPKVLRRVVAGFLSEDRVVKHPAIGIFCRDAIPLGALIDSVTKGSPADKAGLMKNDIIKSMNNQAVRDQIDFAKIMASLEVGDSLKIWVQRNGLQQMITVQVGI